MTPAAVIHSVAERPPWARAGRSAHSEAVVARSCSGAFFVSGTVLAAGHTVVSKTLAVLALHGM